MRKSSAASVKQKATSSEKPIRRIRLAGIILLATFAVAACSKHEAPADAPAPTLDGPANARLVDATSEPQNWLTHGGTYFEQRFSPLTAIDQANVGALRLAW